MQNESKAIDGPSAWVPPGLPLAVAWGFGDICEIVRLFAELHGLQAPTAGDVYDLVNWRHQKLQDAQQHERMVQAAVAQLAAAKVRIKVGAGKGATNGKGAE